MVYYNWRRQLLNLRRTVQTEDNDHQPGTESAPLAS